jgi:hypothetical protein
MELAALQYRLALADGRALTFRLRLDPATFETLEPVPPAPPAWTELTNHQCPNCPLTARERPHCPAAVALARVLDGFAAAEAYAPVLAELTTPERTISARVPLARALSSLAGLVMATSGCPRTAYLRPMARFHLPFATSDETLYRVASMYLLAQYFVAKQGGAADTALEALADRYRELQTVNTAMTARLKSAYAAGPAAAAITALDLFSHQLPFDVRSNLDRIRRLFEPYLT